jgi:lysophospholipase L1-like esterase
MRSMMLLRAFLALLLLALAPAARAQLLPAPARPLNVTSMSAMGVPAPQGFTLVGTRTGIPTYAQNGQGLNQRSVSRTYMRFPAGANSVSVCFYGGTKNNGVTPQSQWTLRDVTVSAGGTGYAIGDTITLPTTSANRAPVVRVTQVAAGAVVKAQVDDSGWYYTQLPDGTAQASTSGAGTGALFTLAWNGYALGVSMAIEPTWNTQTTVGANAIIVGTKNFGHVVGSSVKLSSDIMVPAGQIVCSDPMTVNIPVGGLIGSRMFASGVSMGMQGTVNSLTGAEGWNLITNQTSLPDDVGTAPMPNLAYSGTFAGAAYVEPLMIIGRPKNSRPSLCFTGDSIGVGTNGGFPATNTHNTDVGDADGFKGWLERSTASYYPFTNLSSGGDAYTTTFADPATYANQLQMISLAGCSAVVLELSINDLAGNAKTAAQVLAYEQQFVAALRAIPTVKQVIGSTTVPYTFGCSSTSLGTGCAGGRAGFCTNIGLRNTDLRNGLNASGTYNAGAGSNYAGMFDAVIDFGTVIETALGSCLWQSAALGDGLHPSTAGHILMGAVANAVFQAVLK